MLFYIENSKCYIVSESAFQTEFNKKLHDIKMTFTVTERDAFRKSIVQYQVQNSTKTKAELVAHFQQQGVPRRTIYNNITKLEKEGSTSDGTRSDRPSKKNIPIMSSSM